MLSFFVLQVALDVKCKKAELSGKPSFDLLFVNCINIL